MEHAIAEQAALGAAVAASASLPASVRDGSAPLQQLMDVAQGLQAAGDAAANAGVSIRLPGDGGCSAGHRVWKRSWTSRRRRLSVGAAACGGAI